MLDTVGWVIWPVKIVRNMTYNVFGGTLNPTLQLLQSKPINRPWQFWMSSEPCVWRSAQYDSTTRQAASCVGETCAQLPWAARQDDTLPTPTPSSSASVVRHGGSSSSSPAAESNRHRADPVCTQYSQRQKHINTSYHHAAKDHCIAFKLSWQKNVSVAAF